MHVKVLCFVFAVYMCTYVVQGQKVPVTVYYESLCPDSKKFFTSQLYPTLTNTNLSRWVNLTLVPFGKVTTTILDGAKQYQCHHGPFECYGNKIQACALHEIEKFAPTRAGDGFNNITLAFINCLMDKVENKSTPGNELFEFPIKLCSEMNNVQDYVKIENCAEYVDSLQYLAQLDEMTASLKPPLKSVPTIVFQGQFKQEDSDLAQTNFVKALCQYIKNDKPNECKSSAATLTVSMLAFAFLLLKQLF